MVPRPEDQKDYPERRATQEAGEIYSNSSDEDCAKLVKAGQLDTFSRPRTIAHQNPTGLLGDKSIKAAAERGRQEKRPILTERRNARSSSRDTIRVNDRVIVKEKYIGTCRYVGPIEEKYILPEIFIGVELDEPLTNNSGIFGSRQYFDCEHGYGLMVSSTKVRKIRDVAFATEPNPRRGFGGMKSAKSYSDLSKLKREPRYRVSNGYRQLDRNGKSQTLLNQNLNIFDHPMSTLNNIKRFQSYGIYPNDLQSQRSAPIQDQYGLPLQFQNSYPFPEGDLLRESFRRIVAPSAMYRPHPALDPILYRNRSLPQMYKSQSVNQVPSNLFRTHSMPNAAHYDSAGRRVSTASSQGYSSGSGTESPGGAPHPLSLPPPLAKNFNTPYYYKYRQPLCPRCSACKTCFPVPISQLSGNTVPNFTPQVLRMRNTSEESPPTLSEPPPSKRSFTRNGSHLRSHPLDNSNLPPLLKTLSFNSIESIEYEKWKANYGKAAGRGMKKGLNKLTSAILYN